MTVGAVSVIRGTALVGYSDLLAEFDVDPAPLLRASGLKASDVGDHDSFVDYRSVVKAIESAAAATGARDFGRQLALRQGIDILGPIGVAARTSSTVAEAFLVFEKYLAAYSPSLEVSTHALTEDPARSFFEFRIVVDRLPVHAQVIELGLGVTLQVFRLLWGPGYRPLLVHLPHERLAPRADYVRYYSCTPKFAEPAAGFTISTQDLARPLSRDEVTHRALMNYLDGVVTSNQRGMAQPVRDLVRQLLPTGAATLDFVAAQFNLHPKTLQRRLAKDGTSFAQVIDGVRQETAERYLRDTDLSLTHLAHALGYAEQSVLTRSCQRWFGRGPAAQRNASRGLSTSLMVTPDVPGGPASSCRAHGGAIRG